MHNAPAGARPGRARLAAAALIGMATYGLGIAATPVHAGQVLHNDPLVTVKGIDLQTVAIPQLEVAMASGQADQS